MLSWRQASVHMKALATIAALLLAACDVGEKTEQGPSEGAEAGIVGVPNGPNPGGMDPDAGPGSPVPSAMNDDPEPPDVDGGVRDRPLGNEEFSDEDRDMFTCLDTAQPALEVLTDHCAGCHSDPDNARAGFSTVLDAEALLASGKVTPYQPDMSPIYVRISTGMMPPMSVADRPSEEDIWAIQDWIACGAPDWGEQDDPPADDRPDEVLDDTPDFRVPGEGVDSDLPRPRGFITVDDRLDTVNDDLRAAPIARRTDYRYIDLTPLANAGSSGEELELYRQAVTFVLNSLSAGRSVVAPRPVDEFGLMLRIDLRDYVWDDTDWDELEAEYPYGVIYDEDSRLYPFDESLAEEIRDETDTEIPVIQGDWFISHASRPPLYYTLLKLPNNLQQLQQQLGFDIGDDIQNEEVIRSGFAASAMSENNRVIEQHELDGGRGSIWIGYDFDSSVGDDNVFGNPLDFGADGASIIFNLENGLQGYFLTNQAGQRLDSAEIDILRDPASRDGSMEAGLSCMSCHLAEGIRPKLDEVADVVLRSGANVNEIEAVLALYGDEDVLGDAFETDQDRYRDALGTADLDALTNTTMHELDNTHLGPLDLDTAASVLGIPPDQLLVSINGLAQLLPQEFLVLRSPTGAIPRDAFDAAFDEIVEALGLGQQITVAP